MLPIGCAVMCLSLFCCAILCFLSRFAIILKRKRELAALLLLSYGCIVTVNVFVTLPYGVLGQEWLFIVSIPDICGFHYCAARIS